MQYSTAQAQEPLNQASMPIIAGRSDEQTTSLASLTIYLNRKSEIERGLFFGAHPRKSSRKIRNLDHRASAEAPVRCLSLCTTPRPRSPLPPRPRRPARTHAASGVSELLLAAGAATTRSANPPPVPAPAPVESALASTSLTSLSEKVSLSMHGGELEYARWLLGRNAGVGWAVSLGEAGSELGFEISSMWRNCANLRGAGRRGHREVAECDGAGQGRRACMWSVEWCDAVAVHERRRAGRLVGWVERGGREGADPALTASACQWLS